MGTDRLKFRGSRGPETTETVGIESEETWRRTDSLLRRLLVKAQFGRKNGLQSGSDL